MKEKDLVGMSPENAAKAFMEDMRKRFGEPNFIISRRIGGGSQHRVEWFYFSKGSRWIFEWDNVAQRCELAMCLFVPPPDSTPDDEKLKECVLTQPVAVTRVPYRG